MFHCHGRVRCRFPALDIIPNIRKKVLSAEIITDVARFGPFLESDVCSFCQRFQKPLVLQVRDLDAVFIIYL